MEDLNPPEDLFVAAGRYGYLHPGYAEAYLEAGEVRHLRRSGAWLLTRAIPGSDRSDALVGHPLLVCRDWQALPDELLQIAALADVVTISARTDPLAPVDEASLQQTFPDVLRIEAQHFVVDLPAFWPSREHRRAIRRAFELVEIDIEGSPAGRLETWERLAAGPGGVMPDAGSPALSRGALERQLAVPGCVGVTALAEDGPVAMAIVYLSGEDAHVHAVACDARGSESGARYALYAATVEEMAGRGLRRLDLGPADALDADAAADAVRFMSGWTELTRPSYRCGRIVDRLAYDALAAEAGTTGSATFPAYREAGRRDEASRPHPGGGRP